MSCDGIDCGVYSDGWKNLNGGIQVESAHIQIFPWSLDCEEDAITNSKLYKNKNG
jgi:hypothetical protein